MLCRHEHAYTQVYRHTHTYMHTHTHMLWTHMGTCCVHAYTLRTHTHAHIQPPAGTHVRTRVLHTHTCTPHAHTHAHARRTRRHHCHTHSLCTRACTQTRTACVPWAALLAAGRLCRGGRGGPGGLTAPFPSRFHDMVQRCLRRQKTFRLQVQRLEPRAATPVPAPLPLPAAPAHHPACCPCLPPLPATAQPRPPATVKVPELSLVCPSFIPCTRGLAAWIRIPRRPTAPWGWGGRDPTRAWCVPGCWGHPATNHHGVPGQGQGRGWGQGCLRAAQGRESFCWRNCRGWWSKPCSTPHRTPVAPTGPPWPLGDCHHPSGAPVVPEGSHGPCGTPVTPSSPPMPLGRACDPCGTPTDPRGSPWSQWDPM